MGEYLDRFRRPFRAGQTVVFNPLPSTFVEGKVKEVSLVGTPSERMLDPRTGRPVIVRKMKVVADFTFEVPVEAPMAWEPSVVIAKEPENGSEAKAEKRPTLITAE